MRSPFLTMKPGTLIPGGSSKGHRACEDGWREDVQRGEDDDNLVGTIGNPEIWDINGYILYISNKYICHIISSHNIYICHIYYRYPEMYMLDMWSDCVYPTRHEWDFHWRDLEEVGCKPEILDRTQRWQFPGRDLPKASKSTFWRFHRVLDGCLWWKSIYGDNQTDLLVI